MSSFSTELCSPSFHLRPSVVCMCGSGGGVGWGGGGYGRVIPGAQATAAPLTLSVHAQPLPPLLRMGLTSSGNSLSPSFQTPELSKRLANPTL